MDYYEIEKDYSSKKVSYRSQLAIELAANIDLKSRIRVFLELGCAFGGTVAELRGRGHIAFGIDLNSDAIAKGRERGNEFIFDCPPEQFLEVAKTPVDVVISYHMLEHVPDLVAYLRKLAPLLDDGAIVMFRVPNGAI